MRRAALLLLAALGVRDSHAGDDDRVSPPVAGRVVRVEIPRRTEVRVSAGTFWMGVDSDTIASADARCKVAFGVSTAHTITGQRVSFCDDYLEDMSNMEPRQVFLDAYSIDRQEVSVAAYRDCVAAGACDLDALIAGDERYIRDEWPMVNVTWGEAQTFCRWRGGRLPTEAEWERAARGDDPAATWPWGELEQPKDFNHGQERSNAMTSIERTLSQIPIQFFGDPDDSDGASLLAPPGSYVWGQSPFGTLDQAGNVAEWTADAFVVTERIKGYSGLPDANPLREASLTNHPRVVRGGSWRQPIFVAKSNLRDPFNSLYDANRRFSHVGFRCARSAARPHEAAPLSPPSRGSAQ